jgi:hypothetical protein
MAQPSCSRIGKFDPLGTFASLIAKVSMGVACRPSHIVRRG